jgi:outer membrane protein TolC
LLQGRAKNANLARLRQAQLDIEISAFELRGAAEALLAQVENAYWDLIRSTRAIAIFEDSLRVAERQFEEIKERIRVGTLPATEEAAMAAEVADRKLQLIEARGNLAQGRLILIRLLGLPEGWAWDRPLALGDEPEMPPVALDPVETHAGAALSQRADLHQARLQAGKGELELARTRDGLLPKLDFFVRLGGSLYANSLRARNDVDGSQFAYSAGFQFSHPWGNREAKARHERTGWSLEQMRLAIRNMEQLAQAEVRAAFLDAGQTAERIPAAEASRKARERALSAEEEKFGVGRSTAFQVAQARRDFLASRLACVDAAVAYRKALLDLYRLDGSLLPRKGIKF